MSQHLNPGPDVAPYDFGEFQRRAAARGEPLASRRVAHGLRLAAIVAPLALLLSIAGVERQGVVTEPAELAFRQAPDDEPALVRAGATARVDDLEDRIAWLDAMISEAPVAGIAPQDRAALKTGRDTLADSLQRVRYAQTLLAY